MKKSIIFIVLLCMGCGMVHAQEVYNSSGKPAYHKKKRKKGYDPDKLIIGGGLNGGIGGGYVNAGISPIVGYRITDNFSAGVGIGYQYYRTPYYNPYGPDPLYSHANLIYPSIWARHIVYRNIFVESIIEYNMITQRNYLDDYGEWHTDKIRYNAPCALLGVGVRQPLGGRASFYGEIMYDVLQDQHSPYYGRPVLKLGVAFGF